MDWKIELVPVPVADLDRAKAFYGDQVGFNVDFDHEISEDYRIIQITPPGSGCSILLSTGVIDTPPGSIQGIQIVVDDVAQAREELVGRGVDVTPIFHWDGTAKIDGPGGRWNSFVEFYDLDGNRWVLQERAPAEPA